MNTPRGPVTDLSRKLVRCVSQIDLEKDGFTTPEEWRTSEEIFAKPENASEVFTKAIANGPKRCKFQWC